MIFANIIDRRDQFIDFVRGNRVLDSVRKEVGVSTVHTRV